MAQEKCPNRQIAEHRCICIEPGWRPTSFDHEIGPRISGGRLVGGIA